jgi:hypothetical protein
LAEEFHDQHLAERLRAMAIDLIAKADDVEELPSERLRHAQAQGRLPAQELATHFGDPLVLPPKPTVGAMVPRALQLSVIVLL